MALIDISRTLRTNLAGWPGDTDFSFRLATQLSASCPVNVGTVTMSTHFATHVDAPFHFQANGRTVEQLPLELFLGRAMVVAARGNRRISREAIDRDFCSATRILIRTDAWTDERRFPDAIPTIDPDVPAWLRSLGVVLLGIDLPSVDVLDSKDLPIHHELARNGIVILESLDLSGVGEGLYELIALPLRLAGGDAAPVRAVLRTVSA